MSKAGEEEDRYFWHPGRTDTIEEYLKKVSQIIAYCHDLVDIEAQNRPSILTTDITDVSAPLAGRSRRS